MKLIAFSLIAFGVSAQGPVFEVASVKPSQGLRPGATIRNEPGRFGQSDSDVKNQAERMVRIRSRLRHLLEERFQLQLREETREMRVFALQVEKGGPRMIAAPPIGNVNMNSGAACSTLSGKGMTMPRLADILSGIAGRRP